jgi:hypothetical protein
MLSRINKNFTHRFCAKLKQEVLKRFSVKYKNGSRRSYNLELNLILSRTVNFAGL